MKILGCRKNDKTVGLRNITWILKKGLGVNDALPWTAKLVTDDLMKQIRTRTNALLQDPKYANNPTAAANAAMAEVMARCC